MTLCLWVFLCMCVGCQGAESEEVPLVVQPLIQPQPPAQGEQGEAHGARRINDFLNDCFLHKKLQAPLDLILPRTPLIEVVTTLAERAGFSVVMDDSLSGMVPLLVARGEPIGRVLHALLTGRPSPWGILISGDVMHIAPHAVLVRRVKQQLASSQGEVAHAAVVLVWLAWTEPLKMRLEAMWHQCLKQHIGPSRCAYFFADDESRRILVQGTPPQVALFKRMVAALDVPTPQVRIEARVVIARTDFMTKLGLRAQFLYAGGKMPPTSVGATMAAGTGIEVPLTFGGTSSFMSTLTMVLNAAEQRNMLRTLLAPHIMSCSGKQATLHEGQSIPIESYTEDAIEGRTRTMRSAQYRDVGVKVQLKPYVLADGKRVKIDVLVENSHISSSATTTTYPTITTSSIHNSVLLTDKQVVLLGGLTQTDESEEENGVPWLSQIPILRLLFSGAARAQQEKRLYVFLYAELLPVV